MFATCASAPDGSPPPRPSFCCRVCFCCGVRTSKATLTCVTPSSALTASATPVEKWLRIGQPGVVSETMTSTTPFSWMSTERTMSSSTMLRRSSGSMTLSSAWRTASFDGMPPLKQPRGATLSVLALGRGDLREDGPEENREDRQERQDHPGRDGLAEHAPARLGRLRGKRTDQDGLGRIARHGHVVKIARKRRKPRKVAFCLDVRCRSGVQSPE